MGNGTTRKQVPPTSSICIYSEKLTFTILLFAERVSMKNDAHHVQMPYYFVLLSAEKPVKHLIIIDWCFHENKALKLHRDS